MVLVDRRATGDAVAVPADDQPRWWNGYVLSGLGVCLVIGIADAVGGTTLVLIPLLVIAPLVASIRATERQTALVGVVAVVTAIGLGWVDDIAGSRRHWVAIATTSAGTILAIWLAASRSARARQLATSLPAVDQVDRLRAALTIGRMGEWSWNRNSDEVVWDRNVEALFGLFDGQFKGTFESWLELVDERDRASVQNIIQSAVEAASDFRFDHRCSWPDGSIHWVEGVGEVIVDDGIVVGAFGLAMDVDERHRQMDERNRLVELERRERRRVEYLGTVQDVLALSVNTEEIAERITTSVIPELADWCSIVVTADRPRARPFIKVAHRDPDKVRWAEQVQFEQPYDPDASFGAALVIRTGQKEFIEHVDPFVFELPGGDVLRRAGVASAITVPLVGALGILGAIQLIRGDHVEPFTSSDLDFIDELANRVGPALNTAVLFERQARSRAALDTLEEVSGRIASVATAVEVMEAALVHGARGVGASVGAIYLLDSDVALARRASVGPVDESGFGIEMADAAARSAAERGLVSSAVTGSSAATIVGVPLQIMNRTTGSIVFVVDAERLLTAEELSMLVTLGSRCAGALERASLYERERAVALTLQHRLLSVLPSTPEWMDAAARYVPATGIEIGGDWFQLLDAGAGHMMAVVGDAVGHGLASAAAMGQLRASIATAVATDSRPGRALAAVDLFARRGADTFGASVACVLLGPNLAARFSCAGLPPTGAHRGRRIGALPDGRSRPPVGPR